MIAIRIANSADNAHIHALIKEGGINPLGLAWQNFVIAVDEYNRQIGCCQLKPHPKDGVIELASLAVTEQWHGKGIANALIHAVLAKANAPIWLMCEAELEALYVKYDFVRMLHHRAMPGYFGRMHRAINTLPRLLRLPEPLAIMRWDGWHSERSPIAKAKLVER